MVARPRAGCRPGGNFQDANAGLSADDTVPWWMRAGNPRLPHSVIQPKGQSVPVTARQNRAVTLPPPMGGECGKVFNTVHYFFTFYPTSTCHTEELRILILPSHVQSLGTPWVSGVWIVTHGALPLWPHRLSRGQRNLNQSPSSHVESVILTWKLCSTKIAIPSFLLPSFLSSLPPSYFFLFSLLSVSFCLFLSSLLTLLFLPPFLSFLPNPILGNRCE